MLPEAPLSSGLAADALCGIIDNMAQKATAAANPNGSQNNIAGIVNREGNVLGMMPHPERAVEEILGSADGLKVFQSMRTSQSSMSPVGGH